MFEVPPKQNGGTPILEKQIGGSPAAAISFFLKERIRVVLKRIGRAGSCREGRQVGSSVQFSFAENRKG